MPTRFSSALDAQQQACTLNKQSWMARMKERAMTLKQDLPARSVTALSMRWADQPGASTWLTALPLTSNGFDLTRREFHDGLCLRYGWKPSHLPSSCSCGQRFGLEHALTCRRGGYVAMRHDEVRDLFSELLAEKCSNVTTEPELQPLDGVSLQTHGAHRQDGAQLSVAKPFPPICVLLDVSFAYFSLVLRILTPSFSTTNKPIQKSSLPITEWVHNTRTYI